MRVIVIGSGIAGASTAYHLARRGVEVAVVDTARSGAATEAGAGIVCPWTSRRGDAEIRAASMAASYYPALLAQLAEDGVRESSFETVGALVVGADETELEATYQLVVERAAEAPAAGQVSRLDAAQARELFPVLAPELAAVHVSGGGRVDGRRLRRALLTAASRRGAETIEGHAELTGRGVLVAGERRDADKVVVAAGAWSREVVAPLGVHLAVEPQRGQISHFELPGVDTSAWPVVLPQSSHYLLAFPGSRVVAGATRETGSGFDYRVTAAGQHEVLTHALGVAPGLADATLLETRIGFRPASPDGLPLLGPLDGHPDVLMATGFGPTGLTVAPFAGALLASIALGEAPAMDVSSLRPGRFSSG
ncbi:NAD(P)/FAD-dependent oxidoreductase [Amycolatopsis taiwanensis]|uniref:Oxidoreductase n=1 Tax=Amycolatopsis taiwanensis TaxID=342230 RepID=A0A9W6R015_9PSEU|nr:FAD-binding oxidoreductase [Amycolatopsis taiwanensis]GLY67114.1 oxidoreductase [Amycolatopsis taiwanensis]